MLQLEAVYASERNFNIPFPLPLAKLCWLVEPRVMKNSSSQQGHPFIYKADKKDRLGNLEDSQMFSV